MHGLGFHIHLPILVFETSSSFVEGVVFRLLLFDAIASVG